MRVQAIAAVIRQADEHGHLIGNQHHSGTVFKAWQEGGALNHFAMQLSATDDAAHAGAIEALQKAAGRYQVIYSESTAMRTDEEGMRRHAWAVAMGGLTPMLLRMDIASTPVESLRQCRYLQQFFEATDFYRMAPHDELKHGETRYVLGDPGRSYIAYADHLAGKLGVKDLPAGRGEVTWLDCRSGRTAEEHHSLPRGRPRVRQTSGVWARVRGVDSFPGPQIKLFLPRRARCRRVGVLGESSAGRRGPALAGTPEHHAVYPTGVCG